MKIDIYPLDRFNDTLQSAKCPRDLFGENPPKSHREVADLLKVLRASKEEFRNKDISTTVAFEKLETFLEWTRHLVISANFDQEDSEYKTGQEYLLKLKIPIQDFEGKKMFRVNYYSKTVFFSIISAEAFLGFWWHDRYELVRDGSIVHEGQVDFAGFKADCNLFTDSRKPHGEYRLRFLAEEFEIGDEIHFYTIKYRNAGAFLYLGV